ncbi:MAG: hypothetical protein ACE5FJ_07135, partial [Gemmatimonadales bacterium]
MIAKLENLRLSLQVGVQAAELLDMLNGLSVDEAFGNDGIRLPDNARGKDSDPPSSAFLEVLEAQCYICAEAGSLDVRRQIDRHRANSLCQAAAL